MPHMTEIRCKIVRCHQSDLCPLINWYTCLVILITWNINVAPVVRDIYQNNQGTSRKLCFQTSESAFRSNKIQCYMVNCLTHNPQKCLVMGQGISLAPCHDPVNYSPVPHPQAGGRSCPGVVCWTSGHWAAGSNPPRGMFHHSISKHCPPRAQMIPGMNLGAI